MSDVTKLMENQQQKSQPIQNQPVEGSTPSQVEGPTKLYPEPSGGTNKKLVVIVIVILALTAIGAGAYLWWQSFNNGGQQACTMEAKLCLDGSSVGRTGPNCEFAPCPGETSCEGGTCPSEGEEEAACQDLCGDGVCQEVVCMAIGCPCAETAETCPQDCGKEILDWHVYKNTEYGFQMTFTDAWRGYRAVKKLKPGAVNIYRIYFEILTISKEWMSGYGYASPMAVDIYPISEWRKVEQEVSMYINYPWRVELNNNYAFHFVPTWQDTPSDLESVDFKIDQILSTFKFIK